MMSIVKFINVYNNDPEVTVEMHNYLSDDLKTDSGKYIAGLGFITDNYLDEFNAVKVANQKNCGNQFKQITISLSPAGNSCSDEEYIQIGLEIAQPLYDKGFQVLIYLHKDTDTRHLHLMMNTVSFITGKMFTQSKSELNRFKLHCSHVFTNHKLDPIRKATEAMLDTEMHNISEGFDFLEIFNEIMADKASSLSDLFDDPSDYSSYSRTPNMNGYCTYAPTQDRNYFNPDTPKSRTNIIIYPDGSWGVPSTFTEIDAWILRFMDTSTMLIPPHQYHRQTRYSCPVTAKQFFSPTFIIDNHLEYNIRIESEDELPKVIAILSGIRPMSESEKIFNTKLGIAAEAQLNNLKCKANVSVDNSTKVNIIVKGSDDTDSEAHKIIDVPCENDKNT